MTGPMITFATNNGDVSGGEVMLLLMAEAARELGLTVRVVGPAEPAGLVTRAEAAGHDTVALPGVGRRAYMRSLRRWDRRERTGLLWCNGLVPATATAGHAHRVVHLHQPPTGLQHLARRVATVGAEAVVVPSRWMADQIPGATRLSNWTVDLDLVEPRQAAGGRIGFLGRVTREKGVDVLSDAVAELRARGLDVALVLGGEERYGTDDDAQSLARTLAALDPPPERIGWVGPEVLFSQVDVAAFPSVWPEPFGLVAAEAMAAGVPFVISASGALPEVVGPDHPWIARPGSVTELADRLQDALQTPPARRDEVAKALRTRWETEYSPVAGRERLATVLHGLGLLEVA